MRPRLLHEDLTSSVIGAFYEVYNTLGYGFLEHVYVMALKCELELRGHRVALECPVTVTYKGREVALQRLDLIVDGVLVVEVKATELLHPSAKRQLNSCLKGSGLEVGLLLHFGPKPYFYRAIQSPRGRCG